MTVRSGQTKAPGTRVVRGDVPPVRDAVEDREPVPRDVREPDPVSSAEVSCLR